MKWVAWFSKAEQRVENISDKFKMEITDKKQWHRSSYLKVSLLTVYGSILQIMAVHLILSMFHSGGCLHYGVTMSIFILVFTKIVPYALFTLKKDSKYPSIIFYAFGVTQLTMVGVLFLLMNRVDSFFGTPIVMGCDNKIQVLTSVLYYFNLISLSAWATWIHLSKKNSTSNDYNLKNNMSYQISPKRKLITYENT